MPNSQYSHHDLPAAEVNEPSPDLTSVPETAWTEAKRRFQILRELAETPQRTKSDVRAAAATLGCSVARTYTLLARFTADPTVTSLLPRRRGPPRGYSRLRVELDVLVDQAIESMYLSKQRPRTADLVKEVRRRCHVLGVRAPGRKAITRRVLQKPLATRIARREGRRVARELLAPVLGSLESPGPLGLVQIDHTLVDVMAVDSVTRSPIQRPWLTLAIDVFSRCVAGFHLSLEPPSATSVAICLTQAALPKETWLSQRRIDGPWPICGIPLTLHLDNAKEFHSEALRRGCEKYGLGLEYRPIRTPRYGGHIERLIGTLMGKVHLLPGTTFSDIRSKGKTDPEKTAAMTLDEIERWIGHAIAGVYHRDLHRTLGTAPLAAWQSAVGRTKDSCEYRPPRGVPDARQFFLDFLPLARRQIRREGVRLHSIWYWSDVLRTLVGGPEQLLVRYDPRDLGRVYVQVPDGAYYDVPYADLRRPAISLWEHRLALKRLREEGRGAVDEAAIFQAVEAMRDIADAATGKAKALRRQQERRRHSPSLEVSVSPDAEPRAIAWAAFPEDTSLMDVEEWS